METLCSRSQEEEKNSITDALASLEDLNIEILQVPSTARLWAGETLGALAGLERAGAAFGVHSNWGESGPGWEPQGHFKQCGFEELVTCNDQPQVGDDSTRQPRATYHVCAYTNQPAMFHSIQANHVQKIRSPSESSGGFADAAYGNTSGIMAPVSRHCNDADAFASYDDGKTETGEVYIPKRFVSYLQAANGWE